MSFQYEAGIRGSAANFTFIQVYSTPLLAAGLFMVCGMIGYVSLMVLGRYVEYVACTAAVRALCAVLSTMTCS